MANVIWVQDLVTIAGANLGALVPLALYGALLKAISGEASTLNHCWVRMALRLLAL